MRKLARLLQRSRCDEAALADSELPRGALYLEVLFARVVGGDRFPDDC